MNNDQFQAVLEAQQHLSTALEMLHEIRETGTDYEITRAVKKLDDEFDSFEAELMLDD